MFNTKLKNFRNEIINLCNTSGLPSSVMELVLENVSKDLRVITEKAITAEQEQTKAEQTVETVEAEIVEE